MSPLRVIAGSARGHKLASVPGDKTRPISDRVKESLFNIIRVDLPGARFLDLFGGTGSVGIEALSRGAGYVIFIDNQRTAIDTIDKNLIATRLKDQAQLRLTDAFSFLKLTNLEPFDYIFVAPPQYKDLWSKALRFIDANPDLMVADAWVIVQIDKREYEQLDFDHLDEFDQRTYGNTRLVFYERKP